MILITGATGLLGSYLVAGLLQKGHKVRALKRPGSSTSLTIKICRLYGLEDVSGLLEWREGDVLDYFSLSEAMKGVGQVYHCAGFISFDHRDRDLMMKVNGEGTANVMNTALDGGVKKVCHVSSVSALGKTEDADIITESNWWKTSPGNSFYGISKYTAEREAWRAAEEGLNVVIVNPSIILGAGDWEKGSAAIFSAAYKGMRFYSAGITGFVDARDVVACMMGLMEGNFKNSRYILSAGNMPFRFLFNLIHDEFGRRRPYIKAGKILTGITWRAEAFRSVFTGSKPLITRETARAAQSKIFYSNEKVVKDLGFTFRPLEESIKEICNIYLSEATTTTSHQL